MIKPLSIVLLAIAGLAACAPEFGPAQKAPVLPAATGDTLRLWQGRAPGAKGDEPKDTPSLAVFRPDNPCGSAILVLPGGGYTFLADHEGSAYAQFLNRYGVTAFVLSYRLSPNGYWYPAPFLDATRAMRLIRFRAKEWGIDPERIGVIGSSAGGHLAGLLATRFDKGDPKAADPIDRVSSRPNFAVLCYAALIFGAGKPMGAGQWVTGPGASSGTIEEISAERHVSSECPPCFLLHTNDDNLVSPQNSQIFADALKAKGVKAEVHYYPSGGHGIGLGGAPNASNLHPWTGELVRWLRANNWAK